MCANVPGRRSGSCEGDSGGILMKKDWITDLETPGYRAVQKAVVYGAISNCDSARFPTIFNRLDTIETLYWINSNAYQGMYSK